MALFKKKEKTNIEDAYLKSEDIMNNIASAIGGPTIEQTEQYVQPQQPVQQVAYQQPQVQQVQPQYQPQYQAPVQQPVAQVAPQPAPVAPKPQIDINYHLNKLYDMVSTLDKGLTVLNDRQTAMEARLFRETN